MVNPGSNDIGVYSVDAASGALTAVGPPVAAEHIPIDMVVVDATAP